MSVNIFKDKLQHAQLFGKPVLTTNWLIPRETVPDGWFCYDMRGTERDPAAHAELVDYTSYDHSGTVLSPKPLKRPAISRSTPRRTMARRASSFSRKSRFASSAGVAASRSGSASFL